MGACFCSGACKRLGYCPVNPPWRKPGRDPNMVPITPTVPNPWDEGQLPKEPWVPNPWEQIYPRPWPEKNPLTPPWPIQNKGWICSRCGTSNSPSILTCANKNCKESGEVEYLSEDKKKITRKKKK